ncbi:hypothetical protein ACE6H2_026248 [Prunus campanulata]
MEEFINKFTESFSFTEEEKCTFVVSDAIAERSRCSKSFIVGKVLSSKPVNKGAFINVIKGLWRPKALVEIVSIRDDRFLFVFSNAGDVRRILEGGPWTFGGDLLVLAEVPGLATPASIPLQTQAFWVRIHGLPFQFMTRIMGEELGGTLGTVLTVNCDRHGTCMGDYLRVRVVLDISLPLRRGLQVCLPSPVGSEVLWLLLQYERLPSHCVLCGLLDHKSRACASYKGATIDDFKSPFGSWLRAENLPLGTVVGQPQHYGLANSPASSESSPKGRTVEQDGRNDLLSATTIQGASENHMPDLNIPAPSTPMVEGRSSRVVETAQHPFCLGDGASPANFLQRSFQTTLLGMATGWVWSGFANTIPDPDSQTLPRPRPHPRLIGFGESPPRTRRGTIPHTRPESPIF